MDFRRLVSFGYVLLLLATLPFVFVIACTLAIIGGITLGVAGLARGIDAVVRFWGSRPVRMARRVFWISVHPLILIDRRLRSRRLLQWSFRFSVPPVAALMLLAAWALTYVYWWPGDKPDTRSILEYEPLQIGHMTDANGTVYFRMYKEARLVIRYDQIPDHVRNAFVAAEDGDYWHNDGWDKERTLVATFKAASSKVKMFRYRPQGASGITQQVVRKLDPVTSDLARRENGRELISSTIPTHIVALTMGPVFANRTARKWREIKRSVNLETALEEHFTKAGAEDPRRQVKEAILGTYLNEAYFGHGVYGIGYAAKFFFQKDCVNLTVPEAAYLASLLPAPVRYAKLDGDPAAMKIRRDQVLKRMVNDGFLEKSSLKSALNMPLKLDVRIVPVKTEAPAAVNVALFRDLPQSGRSQEQLLEGRIQVQTTLRMDLQRIVNEAARRGIYGNGKKPPTEWAERYPGTELPQVAIVVLGPKGEVLAMHGGEVRDPKYEYNAHMQLNRVLALESPGSTIKIVDNIAALMAGFTPDTTISDADVSVCMRKDNNGNCAQWKSISNYEAEKFGVLPLWEWSARSINTPYMRLMKDMVGSTPRARAEADALEVRLDKEAGYNVGNIDPGAAWMLKWAGEMGISTPLKPYISTVLGGSEVTVLDMANVIRTAGTGKKATPYIISRITDNDGKELYANGGRLTDLPVPTEKMVQLQALLYNNVRNPEGTGHSLDTAEFGIEVAGKTGTSDDWRDAWYCGYNPGTLYICIHVGYDTNKSMPGEGLPIYRAASGGWVALPIFREIMEKSLGPGKPMGLPNKMPEPVKEMVNAYLARRLPEAAK